MQTSQTSQTSQTIPNKFELYEYYERSRLEDLLNSDLLKETWSKEDLKDHHHKYYKKQFENERKQLQWILDNIDNDGLLKVKYVRNSEIGRHKISGKVGLVTLRRVVRNYLCDGIYYDFDIKNANMSIIMYLISKYDIQGLDTIKNYHDNYERTKIAIKNHFQFNNDEFKHMMITLVYGFECEYKTKSDKMINKIQHICELTGAKKDDRIIPYLTKFIENLKILTTELQKLNIWNIDVSHTTYNQQGSWLSKCIQTVEDDIVFGLKIHLITNYPKIFKFKNTNKNVSEYEYDGFKPLVCNVAKDGFEKMNNVMSDWLVSNGYGTFISFINKPMKDKLYIEPTLKKDSKEECADECADECIFIDEEEIGSVAPVEQIETLNTMENDKIEQSPITIANSFSPVEPELQTHIDIDFKNKPTQLDINIKNKQSEIDTLELIDVKELGDTDKKEHLKNLKLKKCQMRDLNNELKEQIKLEKQQLKERDRLEKERIKLERQQEKERIKLEIEQQKENNKNNYTFVCCDDEAIDIIIERIGHLFAYIKGQMYYKSNNKWIHDDDEVNNILMKYILESQIYETNKNFDLIPYCQNVSTSINVRRGLLAKLSIQNKRDDLYDKFHSSTKNKLCFNDGILDFIEKRFIRWNDIPENTIYTTIIIDRNYEEYFNNPNRYFIGLIYNDILLNLFGDKTGIALKFFARAITGNMEDKNFMSYCGNRDCGKGILYALFEWAFKEYIGSFNLENITCKRESNKSSDLAKENAWLLPLQFVRFAITQETDENENDDIKTALKLSNKVMKSIMSGGDELKARALYKDIMSLTLELTIGIFGNNEIAISGNDSAKHHLKFSGVKTFVTQDEYDEAKQQFGDAYVSSYSIKDETLKEKVKTEDYANAMVHLLYESFENTSISVIANDDGENAYQPIRASIFKSYEFTGNDKDRISKDELFQHVIGDKKKITAELKQLGCVGDDKCRTTITYTDDKNVKKSKQVQAFKCLKLKTIGEENIDEEKDENIDEKKDENIDEKKDENIEN